MVKTYLPDNVITLTRPGTNIEEEHSLMLSLGELPSEVNLPLDPRLSVREARRLAKELFGGLPVAITKRVAHRG